MSMISSANQSFSIAQSNTRKTAALELLNAIGSPGSSASARKHGDQAGGPRKTAGYRMQTYRINVMLPTALLLKEYDPKIQAVRFSFSIKRTKDELIWQSNEDSQISQIDYIEQEIEAKVDELLPLMKTGELRQTLIDSCKQQIQNGPEKYPEFQYKTAQQLRLEQQERQINEQLERQAIMMADVKPFNAANVQKKEITVEQPTFQPRKFTKIEPKDYQGPYTSKKEQPNSSVDQVEEQATFKPQICKKSQELAKKGKFSSLQNPIEYEKQRQDAIKQMQQQLLEEEKKLATRRPQITKLAENLEFDIKNVFERQEKKRIEAEGKLKLMQNAQEQKEVAGLTFKPQILEYKRQKPKDDVQQRYQKSGSYQQNEREEYERQKRERDAEELKECTFQPRINEKSKKLAVEYQKTLQEKEIQKQIENSKKPEVPIRTEEEKAEFYEQLYQKGQNLLTYKKAFEEFAESTNVILASSVHTNPRSYQMAKKSYVRQCEKIFDELQQNGVVISRKIGPYTKRMTDLRMADRLKGMVDERDVWVREEFIEYLLSLDE